MNHHIQHIFALILSVIAVFAPIFIIYIIGSTHMESRRGMRPRWSFTIMCCLLMALADVRLCMVIFKLK